MAPNINCPDPTFPDDNIFGASISSAGYPPHAPPITYTSAENLYQDNAEPFEFPAEFFPEYNFEAPSLASKYTTQWTGIDLISLPGSAGEGHVQLQDQDRGADINLALTSAKTGYVPDPQVQRAFLQFLVSNRYFLQSLPDSTPYSIARVKQAFELNSLTFDRSADLDIIIQQFEPQVGTPAIRRECDLKKKDATSTGKFVCPFRFCDGHFTRGTGLQNHLAAHFRLKPCQCSRCGKYYSDTAFDRHVNGCMA